MTIRVDLAVILATKRLKLKELEEKTGIALNNLSMLKTEKAKAIRFSTLEAICKALDCQPGDLLRFEHDKSQGD
jgi:putative transcriptional regulator